MVRLSSCQSSMLVNLKENTIRHKRKHILHQRKPTVFCQIELSGWKVFPCSKVRSGCLREGYAWGWRPSSLPSVPSCFSHTEDKCGPHQLWARTRRAHLDPAFMDLLISRQAELLKEGHEGFSCLIALSLELGSEQVCKKCLWREQSVKSNHWPWPGWSVVRAPTHGPKGCGYDSRACA